MALRDSSNALTHMLVPNGRTRSARISDNKEAQNYDDQMHRAPDEDSAMGEALESCCWPEESTALDLHLSLVIKTIRDSTEPPFPRSLAPLYLLLHLDPLQVPDRDRAFVEGFIL